MSTISTEVSEAEQAKILENSKNTVQVQAFHMQRALDSNKLMDALKHASNMLEELRTGLLGPKAYFDLYGITSEYLRYLEVYLSEDKHGKAMNELYELVQYAGNILQRLYLLITVGSVYIKLKKAPAKEVLKDLVEMCRGVQHPTRGLFLRTYLAEMTKDKLPELNSPYAENGGGDILDCVDFILINFTEMNKLWVRMQHQGTSRDRAKRERERKQLSILVGKNLSLISGLEGVDVKLYKEAILPKVLDQIVSCRDPIAQQDLLDILIQVISDDWHLRTLKPLMKMLIQLEPEVDVKAIIISLMERLGNYIMSPEGGASMTNSSVPVAKELIFPTFFQYITRMIEKRRSMPTEHALAMLGALVDLAYKCYQGSAEYVDKVYDFAVAKLAELPAEQQSKQIIDQIFKLLRTPLDQMANPLKALDIKSYMKLALECLVVTKRRRIALDVAKKVMDTRTVIADTDTAEKLFAFLRIIIAEPILAENDYYDDEELSHEQNLLSALVHRLKSDDIEQQYGMLILAKKYFAGEQPDQTPISAARQRYTLPAIAFAIFNLVKYIYKNRNTVDMWEKKVRLSLKFAYTHTSALYDRESSLFFFKLYFQYAQAASYSGLAPSAKEAIERALEIYDEHITTGALQFEALRIAMSTMRTLYPHFVTAGLQEDWQTLSTNLIRYAAGLVKKADRCRALSLASHLFLIIGKDDNPEGTLQDANSVARCLVNAGKTAEAQENDVDLNLFVDLLNEYLYYIASTPEYAKRCSSIIAHVASQLATVDKDDSTEQSRRAAHAAIYFKNTLRHISASKAKGEPRYQEVVLAE